MLLSVAGDDPTHLLQAGAAVNPRELLLAATSNPAQVKAHVGERNWIQTRRSLKIERFIFSVHTGLTQAPSTMLGETTWIGETAK
jgi:hypothetical protein